MPRSTHNPWLHRFAVLTAVATLALIGIGGVVTSHEAGMAVPDWPSSYGYNMFLFPISKWWHVGNIFYEHSHRLFASGVGLLTTILAVWLWFAESRRWLRWLGIIAFLAVVVQGILGGLRVVLFKDQIGIFHATLAQLFFVLTCAIALFTSRWWTVKVGQASSPSSEAKQGSESEGSTETAGTGMMPVLRSARRLFVGTTLLIFLQLILGATMRHEHSGLAIPDFPLAYGRLWPATDPVSVERANERRLDAAGLNPITASQIILQMIHRITAVLIAVGVGMCAWKIRRTSPATRRLAFFWFGLVLVQIGLGAATVLSNKAADMATAHVMAGAVSLATGALLCIVLFRSPEFARDATHCSDVTTRAPDENPLATRAAAAP
jgi:cytochrome c oxidase assembly protein subunit 15